MGEVAYEDKLSATILNKKTIYVGSAEPSTKYDGQGWVDVSTDPPLLKIYDDTNSAWMTYHATYYEAQTGSWADPSQSPVLNGTIVIVYNDTQAGTRVYVYANSTWYNVATAESPVSPDTTYDDSNESATFVLDSAGFWYIDPDGTLNLEVQHSTEGWLGTADIGAVNGLAISDGTNVRFDYSGGTVNWKFTREIIGGVTHAEGSLAASANHVLPEGIILLAADSSDCQVQVNDGGWATTGFEADGTQLVISDGTNMRLYNNGAGTVYYAYVYETNPG